MVTWKITCDVIKPLKGDVNIFPKMEIIEKEIQLREDSVNHIYKIASKIAKEEIGDNYGYLFTSIDRTDKKTGSEYYQYIVNDEDGMDSEPELKVILDKQQNQILTQIQDAILKNCYQRNISTPNPEETRVDYPAGFLKRLGLNISLLYHNWGKIMNHDEYNSLSNFYNNVTPNEILILNMKDRVTLDDYDILKLYYSSFDFGG